MGPVIYWWGYFQWGGVKKKILLCKGRGHFMKNKNIGGCVLSTQPDQQKGPNAKMRKKCKKKKKYQTLKKFFLTRFAHSAFYKINFS